MKNFCYKAMINMREYKKDFKYNDIHMLTLSIKYPIINIIDNPFAECIINSQISMNVYNYIRYSESYLYDQAINFYNESQQNDFPFHGYEAYMEYKITYNENCFLSVYIDKYEYTGGAHGSTVRSSDTWELCTGMNIPMYGFFNPGTNYKPLLTEDATKQAESNLKQNPGIYFDDYKGLIIKNFNEDSYYLTPQGLTIYYQQYDMAPYSTGIVEFTIPYSIISWYPTCR